MRPTGTLGWCFPTPGKASRLACCWGWTPPSHLVGAAVGSPSPPGRASRRGLMPVGQAAHLGASRVASASPGGLIPLGRPGEGRGRGTPPRCAVRHTPGGDPHLAAPCSPVFLGVLAAVPSPEVRRPPLAPDGEPARSDRMLYQGGGSAPPRSSSKSGRRGAPAGSVRSASPRALDLSTVEGKVVPPNA